ncbi:MAG TPA: TfoX/Sxy family protein [Actinomycetota bacterium]|nr:TfoX/Sxy family protein [Actinomycetota bacterium]
MAYNEDLADRVREVVYPNKDVAEIKMFGGLCFTERGNMFAGVLGDDLVLRVGPDGHDAAIKTGHARPMDFTGKPMKGFLLVAPTGTKTKPSLKKWVEKGLAFTSTLPAKAKKKK